MTLQSLVKLDDVEVDAYFKFFEIPTSMKFHSFVVERFETSFSRQIWSFLFDIKLIASAHGFTDRTNATSPPPQGITSP